MIRLAMFDMAGTTIDDQVAGHPLVIGAALRALESQRLSLTPEQISAQRGQEKRQMMRLLLQEAGGHESLLEAAYAAFLRELDAGLDGAREMPGTREVFRFLRERGVRVGVGSGFPADVTARLVERTGWKQAGLLDYAASAEEVGASRPDPAMILDAMGNLGIADPRAVLKVGDTIMDVLEGRNANAWTVAVLTGTQTRQQLAEAEPDAILASLRDLPAWLSAQKLI